MLNLVFESHRLGFKINVHTLTGESLITRARNNMLHTFLSQPEYDQLLWIDSDIGFAPLNALRLIHSEHEVTATPYPLKAIWWDAVAGSTAAEKQLSGKHYVVNRIGDEKDENGFSEVMDAGTGFMCIKRSALEKMIDAYPELQYTSDGNNHNEDEDRKRYLFFDTMVDDGRYLSEDYAFCRRWQRIGGKVMLDMSAPPLRHFGNYAY
jgi:hypothetical protein